MKVSELEQKNPFSRKVSKILSLEFDPVLDDLEELKKFLVEATGCEDNKFKVYSNGRGGVGLICCKGFFGTDYRLDLRQLLYGYVVVFKYEDGGHDIFKFDSKEFFRFFKEKNASL